MGAAAVAGAAGGALAQSKPTDISAELSKMTKDDPRIQHNKDVDELTRAIYQRMVAERGQPMDRRQQQQWLEIARLKAEERFSQYAPGKPSTTKPSAGFPSQPSEYRRSRNLDNFESVEQGVAEGDKQPADPFKSVDPRVDKPQILGTKNKAKSAYYPPAKPPVKKLDKPLPEATHKRPIAPDPQNYDSDWDYYRDRDAEAPEDNDADYENMIDQPDDWFDESADNSSNYSEQLAQQLPGNLQSEDDVLNAAWPIMVRNLGKKAAHYHLNYDQDFPGDLISAYRQIQTGGMSEGWKEKLGAAALAGSMALGAGGAQARVTYDADGNQIGGLKPTTTQQASPLKAQAQYDINTQILTYNGKQYKWNSQSQATGQGEVVSAPSMAVGSRSMGPTKVELNPNGTYTKAAIDEDQVLESLSRIAELAGVPVKDNLLEYGAPGSRALGTANFALLHRAYVNKRPRLSRNLRLEFGPNQAVDLDDDDIEAIAGYYDTLPTDQDRYNFVYDIMSRGDKFTALLRKLGRRGDLLEQDSKKKSSNPLDRKDVKSVSLNNALRQAYAKYPQANSDIEALALHDLNYQQNTNKDLSAQAKTNKRQDAIDNQLKDLARKQSSKISDLDQENDELSAELDQLNQEINAMSQQVGIKPKDTAKDSDKPSVINLNVGDRSERSQQRQADVKQRDVQKSAPAITTSPAIGQVAQSLANPPAPTIDVIKEPAVALPAKMGAAPAVPDSDGGEQLSMFGPEPEAVPAKSVNTGSEPPAEVPTTLAAPDADEPAELPANVSDIDKARRTRDQLRKATAQQAYDAIKTGTFESKDNSSLFSSLLEMESAKENHRNLVCEMCGRTASDHPFRHPFKVSNK